jgi:hypothetical protein
MYNKLSKIVRKNPTNNNNKVSKRFEKTLHQRRHKEGNKHEKLCLTSFGTWEIQTRTTLRLHCAPAGVDNRISQDQPLARTWKD